MYLVKQSQLSTTIYQGPLLTIHRSPRTSVILPGAVSLLYTRLRACQRAGHQRTLPLQPDSRNGRIEGSVGQHHPVLHPQLQDRAQ